MESPVPFVYTGGTLGFDVLYKDYIGLWWAQSYKDVRIYKKSIVGRSCNLVKLPELLLDAVMQAVLFIFTHRSIDWH